MYVVGVAGQAQNGKDTIADRMFEKMVDPRGAWKRDAFAYALKDIFYNTFGVDAAFVEKWKTNPEVPPGFDMPVRKALQFIGDGFRTIKSTVWVDQPFKDRSARSIISDVRYVNEFTRIKNEGGMNILVGRPDRLNDDPNGSEAQIRPYVKWCLDHFKDHDEKVIHLYKMDWPSIRNFSLRNEGYEMPPDGIELFDLFVMNDGTLEELHALVDESVIPFCLTYPFLLPRESYLQ